MHPLNDKDLDRLSREAAEQFDVESSTTGWDLVENRLNHELPVKAEKERRRFLLWLFFIALMAGGGLVYMLGGNKTSTSIAQQKVSAVSRDKQQAPNNEQPATSIQQEETSKAVATQTEKNTKDISTVNPVLNPSATGSNGTISPKNITAKVSPKSVNSNSIVSGTRSNTKISVPTLLLANKVQVTRGQKDRSATGKNKPVREGNVASVEPSVIDKSSDGKNQVIENNAEKTVNNSNKSKDQQQSDVATTTAGDKPIVDALAAKDASAQKENADKPSNKTPGLTASVKKPNSKSSAPIKTPLEIGVVVGPDQSYVKFKNGDNTGLNLGVQVGYRFSNRWSINTGLILEKKNYKADGADFTPPKTDWSRNAKISSIDGNCSMFDIPLNVRYDFSYNDKRRYFVSTGLTSYLMHHQTYDYYYTWPPMTSPSYEKNWSTDSSMNYFMSVLNLSVGFERTLSKHFSFQVEPYLKVPLKGIGYGNMKLDSYGVFFSVKYKPSLGKKK